MPTNLGEGCGDEEVVVIVLLDIDHHRIGSKLLTNFYRTFKFMKLNSNIIINNNIAISNELIYHTKHNSKLIPCPQLLYRGSRDGFNSEDFHSRCDDQGPTLTIIKSSEPFNQIFGGFTTQSWKSSKEYGEYVSDDSAFIFKIDVDEKSSNQPRRQQQLFRKFNIKQDAKENAIYAHKNYLPIFGAGFDFSISSDCNLNYKSYSNFGFTYELPPPSPSTSNKNDEYEIGSEKARKYLAGSYKFKVLEIEVFKITII